MPDRLILASASPRRAELLRAAGIEFDVRPAAVDESILPGESPERYVRRVAEAKADAVFEPGVPAVLSADTVVVIGGRILGKPDDVQEATAMLRLLSGQTHEVVTGVCLVSGGHGQVTRVDRTRVEFAPLTERELDWYVASGEPMDKAGAYAIQGRASRFVRRIEGSYSNVVGLPVALVYELCISHGILVS
jgi:septum formation protein